MHLRFDNARVDREPAIDHGEHFVDRQLAALIEQHIQCDGDAGGVIARDIAHVGGGETAATAGCRAVSAAGATRHFFQQLLLAADARDRIGMIGTAVGNARCVEQTELQVIRRPAGGRG